MEEMYIESKAEHMEDLLIWTIYVFGGVWQIQYVIVVVVQDLYVKGGMHIEKIYV